MLDEALEAIIAEIRIAIGDGDWLSQYDDEQSKVYDELISIVLWYADGSGICLPDAKKIHSQLDKQLLKRAVNKAFSITQML
jgi:hypothetical protein